MSDQHGNISDPRKYWLDEPKNVKKIIYSLYVVCALLFLLDATYEKHAHFQAEYVFGFYAIYGFIMCVALVLAAKLMRVFLMRDEEYYDKDE
jgi:hypothetical protein